MQVKVEDVSAIKKVITFEIEPEKIVKELDVYYAEIGKEANLKGFRKGKVPRSVLESQFADDANAQIIPALVQDALFGYIKDNKLKIVCDADVDTPEKTIHANKPFIFTATVEVAPEMDHIDFKGLELSKYIIDITDEDVDIQLDQLQQRYAERVPAESGYSLMEGDAVEVDYQAYDQNDEPMKAGLSSSAKNRRLIMGENSILGKVDQNMLGMQVGETRKFTIEFPNDYYHRTLANQTVTYEMTVNKIEKRVLPPLDDELAKKTGTAQTLPELRENIKKELARRVEIQNEKGMYEQMFEQLAEKYTAPELPPGLVELKLDGIYEEMHKAFEQQDLNFEMMGITRESIAERHRPAAEKQAKFHLVVGKIIEQENVTVNKEDLDQGFQELARDLMVPVMQIKTYYSDHPEDQVSLRNGIMERKVFKLIMDDAHVVEKKPPTAEEVAEARKEAYDKDVENLAENAKNL